MSTQKIFAANALASTGLPPRGLSHEQAAAYIGVSVTLFDRMVTDGRMPAAKRLDGRRVWDRVQLDKAFSRIPDERGESTGADQWDGAAL